MKSAEGHIAGRIPDMSEVPWPVLMAQLPAGATPTDRLGEGALAMAIKAHADWRAAFHDGMAGGPPEAVSAFANALPV